MDEADLAPSTESEAQQHVNDPVFVLTDEGGGDLMAELVGSASSLWSGMEVEDEEPSAESSPEPADFARILPLQHDDAGYLSCGGEGHGPCCPMDDSSTETTLPVPSSPTHSLGDVPSSGQLDEDVSSEEASEPSSVERQMVDESDGAAGLYVMATTASSIMLPAASMLHHHQQQPATHQPAAHGPEQVQAHTVANGLMVPAMLHQQQQQQEAAGQQQVTPHGTEQQEQPAAAAATASSAWAASAGGEKKKAEGRKKGKGKRPTPPQKKPTKKKKKKQARRSSSRPVPPPAPAAHHDHSDSNSISQPGPSREVTCLGVDLPNRGRHQCRKAGCKKPWRWPDYFCGTHGGGRCRWDGDAEPCSRFHQCRNTGGYLFCGRHSSEIKAKYGEVARRMRR